MTATIQKLNVQQTTDAQTEALLEHPAMFVNQIFVMGVPDAPMVRMTFGEALAGSDGRGTHVRAALLMSYGTLMAIREVINGIEVQTQANQATKQ